MKCDGFAPGKIDAELQPQQRKSTSHSRDLTCLRSLVAGGGGRCGLFVYNRPNR